MMFTFRQIKRAGLILLALVLLMTSCSCSGKQANNEADNASYANIIRYEEKGVKLSDMSDEDLQEFLISQGLEIPSGCDVPEQNTKAIRYYVEMLDEDINWEMASNMIWTRKLFCRVKAVVCRYYGYDDLAAEAEKNDKILPDH